MVKEKKKPDIRRDYAHRLYMGGESQKLIAQKVGITAAAVSRWAVAGSWKQERDEVSTSTTLLATSLMTAAGKMSETIVRMTADEKVDIKAITQCSDNIAKLMAAAKRITTATGRETVIDVVIGMERWLIEEAANDEELTLEIVNIINKYHKRYIQHISEREA